MNCITETKINNVTVKPRIPHNQVDVSKVKGGNLLPISDNLTLIVSKRGGGKTTVTAKIALETTSKRTQFWIFSPTAKVDPTMVDLIKTLERRGNIVNVYPSLMDGKEDLLNTIIDNLLEDDDVEETKLPELKNLSDRKTRIQVGGEIREELSSTIEIKKVKSPKYKPKKEAPVHCFIIDDLAVELNRTRGGLAKLCFNGRHIHASIYISFQYKNQLPLAIYAQTTFLIIFKNISSEKLEELYKCVDLHKLTFKEFLHVYDYCMNSNSKETHPFLLCEVGAGVYRNKFNKVINYDKKQFDEF